MISAVLDTNILVSGFGWSGSPPARVIDGALEGRFLPVTSQPLLDELARVLRYPKLEKVFDAPEVIVELVTRMSLLVEPAARLQVVAEDDADNRVLEAARAGNADYIVTGDDHLLALGAFERTHILGPSDHRGRRRSPLPFAPSRPRH